MTNDRTLYTNLGKPSIEHGNDPEQPVRDCREAVRRFPTASRPLVELGRWQEAADALGDAVRVAPDSALARDNLGLVLTRLGRGRADAGRRDPRPSDFVPPAEALVSGGR